jgi:DNA polymerase mu
LSAEFIYDTYTRVLEASTKRDTIPHLPTIRDYLVLPIKEEPRFLSDSPSEGSRSSDEEEEDDRPRKKRRLAEERLPGLEKWDEDIELEDIPRFCIQRPSPLVCPNQDLVCLLWFSMT